MTDSYSAALQCSLTSSIEFMVLNQLSDGHEAMLLWDVVALVCILLDMVMSNLPLMAWGWGMPSMNIIIDDCLYLPYWECVHVLTTGVPDNKRALLALREGGEGEGEERKGGEEEKDTCTHTHNNIMYTY